MNPELLHLSPEEIIAHRDGELRSSSAGSHLQECETCRKKLQAARLLAALIQGKTPHTQAASFLRTSTSDDEDAVIAALRPFRGAAVPQLPTSGSIGTLCLANAGDVSCFAEHRSQEVEAREFLISARKLYRARGLQKQVTLRPFHSAIEIADQNIHIRGSAKVVSGSVAVDFSVQSADRNTPLGCIDLTLLTPDHPPRTATTDNEGRARVEVPFGGSLLMIYTDPVLHLAIEVQQS